MFKPPVPAIASTPAHPCMAWQPLAQPMGAPLHPCNRSGPSCRPGHPLGRWPWPRCPPGTTWWWERFQRGSSWCSRAHRGGLQGRKCQGLHKGALATAWLDRGKRPHQQKWVLQGNPSKLNGENQRTEIVTFTFTNKFLSCIASVSEVVEVKIFSTGGTLWKD